MKRLLFALCIIILIVNISSCTTFIRYGTSSKVLISPTGITDNHVTITAIGKKRTITKKDVSLPYKLRVKYKNLPLRVSLESPNYLYSDFTINEEETSWGQIENVLLQLIAGAGLLSETIVGGVLAATGEFDSETAAGIGLVSAIPAFSYLLSRLAVTGIPDKEIYDTEFVPVSSDNQFHNSQEWQRLSDIFDVYDLVSKQDYNNYLLAKSKATYLLEQEATGELLYLRGVSYYHLEKYKDAVKDLSKALNYADVKGKLREDAMSYYNSALEHREAQLERRREAWASFAQAALGTAAQITSAAMHSNQYNTLLGYGSMGSFSSFAGMSDAEFQRTTHQQLAGLASQSIQQVQQEEWMQYQAWADSERQRTGSVPSYTDYCILRGKALQMLQHEQQSQPIRQQGEVEELPTQPATSNGKTCHLCHGIKKCWTCNGTKLINRGFGLEGKIECPNCKQTNGWCSHCKGTGLD